MSCINRTCKLHWSFGILFRKNIAGTVFGVKMNGSYRRFFFTLELNPIWKGSETIVKWLSLLLL